jgi:tetratricopeptide (TPR) repeat protein
MDTGPRGYKARHNLAVLSREDGEVAEAEACWRAAVAEQAGFAPAWLGLGELYLDQGRLAEFEQAVARLEALPHGAAEAALLRARAHLARQEFAPARQLLEEAIVRAPQALAPRVLLSYVFLQEGRDRAGAERALRAVLALDPENPEARGNLAVLLRQRVRPIAL